MGCLPSPSRSFTWPPIMPPTVPEAVASSSTRRMRRVGIHVVQLRQNLESEREQRVARQDRHGVAENFVAGGTAAAQIVVIERRQIVVDQRIGVDQLQRAGADSMPAGASETASAAAMASSGRMRLPPANRL